MDAWLVARCAWALFVLNVMSTLTPTVVCNSTPPRFAAGRSTPEMWMSTPQLARVAGYEAEPHEVRTADGYLLTVHRILPRAASATATAHRTPVLAGHGLASCSEQWVVRPGNLSLRLVDSGFDVWLANYRGSYYGRKHVSLSVKSPRFWDFSWHENGVYDGPALIDHVLAVTGFESLITVGHSMSSTVQLVTLSARPEYAKKMRATILMAPPVYFGHPSGALQMVDQVFKTFRRAKTAYSDLVRDNLFLPTEWPLYTYCYWAGTGERPLELCRIMFELTAGKLQKVIDPKLIRLLMAHYPAGASIRQILHYGQIMLQGTNKTWASYCMHGNLVTILTKLFCCGRGNRNHSHLIAWKCWVVMNCDFSISRNTRFRS
ncbi:hypothetical protein ONE63_007315 [Megalurothrips usitatus]|uniref:Partial AB-hydrolase lipase domain-containing protein n=1 Tax=Megalurothrips usitatus TaxID=439358 RepID=A0AAV7XRP3_9NEOP|nr:hypothetical protein ONE63_007315 [Megalurothrips usitatus]